MISPKEVGENVAKVSLNVEPLDQKTFDQLHEARKPRKIPFGRRSADKCNSFGKTKCLNLVKNRFPVSI